MPVSQGEDMWSERITIMCAFIFYSRDVIAFRNQSRKTEEHAMVAAKSLISSVGDKLLVELTFEDIRAWKFSLEKRHLSQNTIRGYINKLRVVLDYARRKGIDCLDPVIVPLPKRINNIPSFITPQEVSKLIKAVNGKKRGYPECNRIRNQAIISLLYASGIRIGELCRMNRDDISDRTFTVIGKGGKARICFIDERTEELLKKYIDCRKDNLEPLFLANQTKSRIRPDGVQKMMRDCWKKAGLTKPVHPHSLRHSFATDLLRSNTNPRHVQVLLGHSSLDTTMLYMNVVDSDLKEVYRKHHTI